MIMASQCIGCQKDSTKAVLTHNNGLCEQCWSSVSVAQELELWELYSSREPLWCHARHPETGRPCWKETKQKDKECHKAECVNHMV